MNHLHYSFVLIFIFICAIGVNLFFRIHIAQYWRTLLATDASILLLYLIWDTWAVENGNWYFDSNQILNVNIFGKLPIEEILFFILVPIMAIITYKALLKITGWQSESSQQ